MKGSFGGDGAIATIFPSGGIMAKAIGKARVVSSVLYHIKGHPLGEAIARLAGKEVDLLKRIFDNGKTRYMVRLRRDEEAAPVLIRSRFLEDIRLEKPRREPIRRLTPPSQRRQSSFHR